MTIVTRLRIAAVLAITMVAIIGYALATASRQLHRATERYALMDQIVRGIFELHTLTDDYLAQRTPRALDQWRARHQSLGLLLPGLEPDNAEAARLCESHHAMRRLFTELAALDTQAVSPATAAELVAERELQVVAQLQTHERAGIAAAGHLKAINQTQLLRAEQQEGLVVLLAAVIVLGAVLLQVLTEKLAVVRPLRRLQKGIEIASIGDLNHKVGSAARDEIGEVSRAFDRMAENLQRITASRDELNREIAERKRAQAELAASNLELKQKAAELATINRELESFSYSVSHDLRGPLRSIDGFSQAVIEDYADHLDATGRGYLTRLRTASQRMGRLIDDLLLLSRVTRGDMTRRPVDLSRLAHAVAQEIVSTGPERHVEFAITPAMRASGDENLLRIVLTNLLSNAWKFTGPRTDGRIAFGRAEKNGEPVYFVRDNGVGFDMRFVSKLFGPFQRLHSIEEFPGTGIGLATVQRIVHRHGGRVWAEGELGKGATFYFTLG